MKRTSLALFLCLLLVTGSVASASEESLALVFENSQVVSVVYLPYDQTKDLALKVATQMGYEKAETIQNGKGYRTTFKKMNMKGYYDCGALNGGQQGCEVASRLSIIFGQKDDQISAVGVTASYKVVPPGGNILEMVASQDASSCQSSGVQEMKFIEKLTSLEAEQLGKAQN